MKHMKHVHSLARAAAVLVLALLTSATAWAQSLSGSGTAADPYIISSNDDYAEFATNSAYWASGVVVKLTADVSTDKMVGTDTNKFKGNFFGNGHTLTVNLTSVGENCAPFRYAEGAIFTGLHTAGTVTTSHKYGSGLVGNTGIDVTIRNCWSSVTIVSSVDGDGTHGGFVGVAGENNVIKNSRFDGVICCTSSSNPTNSCGGFVGWRNSTLTIENSLFAPVALPEGKYAISTNGTSTFSRNGDPTLTNSYYTAAFGTAQGEAVGEKTAAELATALGSGWQVSEGNVVPVTVNYSLADAIVSGVEPYYLYTGSDIPVAYTVTDFNGTPLTPGTHYTFEMTKDGETATEVNAAGNYTMTFTGVDPYTGSKVINFTVGDGIAVTSETTTFADGIIYKVTEDVTVSSRITVGGSVKLILGEGTTLTASKGIEVYTGKQLTIEGTGKLVSTGTQTDSNNGTSGIGGYEYGDITINGGTVEATGGYRGAGIGGSSNSNFGGTITINGGIVTAQGGTEAAGIGGGSGKYWGGAYGKCGAIVINGGQVTATGGSSAPGIGPGYDDNNNTSGSLTMSWTNATDFISVTGQSSGNFCGFSNRLGSISLAKDFIIMGGSAATTENIKGLASLRLVPSSDEAKKNLANAVITGIAASYYYTGSTISINPVVKNAEGNELTLDTDYTFTLTKDGADATEVNATGNYTMTFTGTGDYSGSQSVNFTVEKYSLDNATITGIADGSTYQYAGVPINFTFAVSANGRTLTLGTDYTATLGGNELQSTSFSIDDPASYELKIIAKDGSIYAGSNAVNFKVTIPAPTNLKQTAYTVDGGTMTWQENGSATQWTLQYSTDRNFSSDVTTVDNLTEATYTATALAAETTYYVRVKSVISSKESAWCSTAMLGTTATKWIGFEKNMVSYDKCPSNTYYRYSLTEQIYTSEEIGQAGLIQSIAFQRTDNETWNQTRALDVYLVHTDKSSFTGSTDWIKVTDADKVFSGSVNLVNHSWTTITLNKPFAYNGTDNLAVIIDDNNDSCRDGVEFACYSANSYQSLFQYSDNNNSNSTPTGTCYDGTTTNAKNQLRITFGLQLADDANNSTVIDNKDGQTTSVQLSGRTLYKDGKWNTLCLPFSLTEEQIAASPLADCTLMALDGTTSNLTAGTLTLNFTPAKSITAGTPYIIMWAEGDNIVDPVFSNVTINKWMTPVEISEGKVSFTGTYVYQSFDAEDKDILFMGGENTLYYPQDGASIGAFRAYFQINSLIEGEEEDVKAFVLNFGDGTTAVTSLISREKEVEGGAYTLDGRKLNDMPAQKGIYIINGKKVAVK